ncbi:MAG: hypothetical protein IH623_27150 [Verrucomicrobia bacterium]|nr:hypothetical protein [Verrucomicrobiota bacterium]
MSVATEQNELLNLPNGERAKLIDVLWDLLSEPEVKWRDAGDVFAELEKKLKR